MPRFFSDIACFNPRPTNWPGDSALPAVSMVRPVFQSAPDQWPGDSAGILAFSQPIYVSIRARPIGRAIQSIFSTHLDPIVFQSAPDQLAGRFPLPTSGLYEAEMFQSAPDQLAGRFAYHEVKGWMDDSFNPRPTNWPGDSIHLLRSRTEHQRFNPRPTNWPGDSIRALLPRGALGVSIRARPIGRAILLKSKS